VESGEGVELQEKEYLVIFPTRAVFCPLFISSLLQVF
jgi:hypothetical protein